MSDIRAAILNVISHNSVDDPDSQDFEELTDLVMAVNNPLRVLQLQADLKGMTAQRDMEEADRKKKQATIRKLKKQVENLKNDTRMLARFKSDCLLAESDKANVERSLADSNARVARLRLKVDGLENQLREKEDLIDSEWGGRLKSSHLLQNPCYYPLNT